MKRDNIGFMTIMFIHIFIQVPLNQFPGYVTKLVGELYDSVEAVVKVRLQGQGALATLVLCESLLSFLPTGSSRENNYRLLKEYEVMPLGTLEQNRRIDLRPYASLRHGVLYVSRPSVEKVWIPLRSLLSSARAMAAQMLDFLKLLREAPATRSASARAARIIVTQFKHDLLELNIVRRMSHFDGPRIDGCIHNACRIRPTRIPPRRPARIDVRVVVPQHVVPTQVTAATPRNSEGAVEASQAGAACHNALGTNQLFDVSNHLADVRESV